MDSQHLEALTDEQLQDLHRGHRAAAAQLRREMRRRMVDRLQTAGLDARGIRRTSGPTQ